MVHQGGAERVPTTDRGPARLLNRDFVLLWQGQLVSQLGNQAFLVAMMFWALGATGSASLLGTLLMVSTLPSVLLAPVAGVIADRHSRKWLIVGSDLLRGLAVIGFAALLDQRPADVDAQGPALLGVAFLNGAVGAVFTPAVAAAIPDLVPRQKVTAANSLNQLSVQASALLGQAVGGVAYARLGAAPLFLFDGLTYLFSSASECFMTVPQPPRREARRLGEAVSGYLRDARQGLREAWRRPGMMPALATFAGVNVSFTPVFVLLPIFVQRGLGAGAEWYGLLLAVAGAGSLAGYVIAGLAGGGGERRIVGCLLAIGTATALLGGATGRATALLALFLIGLLAGLINVLVLTLFQTSTPTEIRGRVMSLVVAVSGAATPLAMGLGGLLGDVLETRHVFAGGGAAIVALAIASWRYRAFARLLGAGSAAPA